MKFEYLIVGAGFAGCTLAERIATQHNKKVLLVEQRNHIGGNTYDDYNDDGILIQKYGPHIFHTNSKEVWDYLCQFTEWNNYVHRVIAKVNGKEVYLPISLDTMEQLYNRNFTPEELENYFNEHRIKIDEIKNSRDVVVSQVGEELYNLFFKNYTKKQWGVYPEELDAQVTKRLPVRSNRDTRYFTDTWQGIPKYGYTKMFEKMLDNKNIHILLNTDYKEIIASVKFDKLIFTGPIDYFFDYMHGKLPYRSLDFRFETLNTEKYQNAAVVNFPNDHDYTRITEFKHFYFQKHEQTTICFEYPKDDGEPYYPVPMPVCQEIYIKYKKEADKLKNVYFIGRLAEYRYLNMDQVILEALKLFERLKNE
ncbi:MAG: UDP-galactopyranose mutase [Candidatus Kuenenia stuttgartiensis]|nr:MAG: UDP-galactopyranose mutase [Candidatus Kuenenia stuttgartiensis]